MLSVSGVSGVSKMAGRERLERIKGRLQPVIAREGFELVEAEMVSERGQAILRLYIDTVPPGTKERGVTVDDCSRVSRVAGDLLDVEDLLEGQYHLEVSSPGLFRPLTKPEHFDRAVGAQVKVKTFEKIDGRRVFIGLLKGHQKGVLTLDIDGKEYVVEVEKVAKANLEPTL